MGIPGPGQPMDIQVIAETLKDVEPIFFNVLKIVDSMPIYLLS